MAMLESALKYVADGFKVFPVKLDKTPYTNHGLKDATQTQQGVKEYWAKWPDAGIAILTEGLIVLDFDAKSGGAESLKKLESDYGPMPKTRVHRTGGGGLHFLFRNPNGSDIRNTVEAGGYKGLDIRANGGYIVVPPSLHPSGKKYVLLVDAPIATATEWITGIAKTKNPTILSITSGQSVPFPEGQRNQSLTRLAGSLRRNGMVEEAILIALLEANKRQCVPPLTEEEVKVIAKSISRYPPNIDRESISNRDNGNVNNIYIETDAAINGKPIERKEGDKSLEKEQTVSEKCNAFRNENETVEAKDVQARANRFKNVSQTVSKPLQEGVTPITLASRVFEWIKGTTAWWTTDELDRDLALNPDEKTARRLILYRLKEQGLIESHPKVNRQWRFINKKLTDIDFHNARRDGVLDIHWPLMIEHWVNFFSGNIAVIAGAPNAGKTAFMLNFIWRNQGKYAIHYFCSEMGQDGVELRDRLEKFEGMAIEDWTFQAHDQSSNFEDVIVPDCINVIDYLEMTEDLWAVNAHLTAINNRLSTGLAIVAIQKKIGAAYGRGQEFGLEKPKLYLSLDKGLMTIVKGKSWAVKGQDPNGLKVKFKIIDGCQFSMDGEWYWEK